MSTSLSLLLCPISFFTLFLPLFLSSVLSSVSICLSHVCSTSFSCSPSCFSFSPLCLGPLDILSLLAQMVSVTPLSLNYSINYCGENVQLKWTVIVCHVAPYLIGLHLISGAQEFFLMVHASFAVIFRHMRGTSWGS